MALHTFEHAPRVKAFIFLTCVVFGAAVIGATSPLTIALADFYFAFSAAFDAGGGNPVFSFAQRGLWGAAGGGGVSLAGGLVVLLSIPTRLRVLTWLGVVLGMLGSLISLAGGAVFIGVLDMVGPKLYIKDTNSINPALTGVHQDVLIFENSIFNECCVNTNRSAQATIGACTGLNSVDCPAITDPIVQQQLPNAQTLLCQCSPPPDAVNKAAKFQAAIAATNFCKKAEKAVINVDGLRLPREAKSLSLTFLTSLRYPSLKYSFIPLVGWYQDPQSDPSPTTGPYPFGCGLGYVKGISWFVDVWHQQNVVNIAYATIALGAVEFFVLASLVWTAYTMKKEEKEVLLAGGVKKEVHDVPADFKERLPGQAPPEAVLGMHRPDSRALTLQQQQYLLAQQQQQQQKRASMASVAAAQQAAMHAELGARLRSFYAVYEPGKSVADVDDVATWGVLNGVNALNQKLMGKYGADLTTPLPGAGVTTSARVAGSNGGIASKALQEDVDI